MIKTYKELIFWQKSYEVTLLVVKLARRLPKDRISFIFLKQIIRSASSVGANIAEGYGKYKGKEYTRFINIALGSANETEYWLGLIMDIYPKYKEEVKLIINKNTETLKMLVATLKALKARNRE
jgi:four helix bundle protein